MATLTVQSITRVGLAPTYVAAAGGGDAFLPSDKTFLHVKNGSGGALTVTVGTPATVYGNITVANPVVSVPAGGERMMGPFPSQLFAEPVDGLAYIVYSGVTSLTIRPFVIQQP